MRKKGRWYWVQIGISMAMVFILGLRGLPDIAPPQQPPGGNPGPEGRTNVQMLEEQVRIRVLMNTDPEIVDARVEAIFYMYNKGKQDEQMDVYFPAQCWGDDVPIPSLEAEVNGRAVPVRRVDTTHGHAPTEDVFVFFHPNASTYDGALCHEWFVFPVTFPVGKQVLIRVRYPLQDRASFGNPAVEFRYLLETGREWRGPIGKGEIVLRLPYPARPENVWVNEHQGFQISYAGPDLRVYFENLEPTERDNLVFGLVVPSLWYPVFRAEQMLQNNPNDGEAWGRLARSLKEILFSCQEAHECSLGGNWPFEEVMQRIFEGYEHATSLLPEDALWHLGYADWLWYCYSPASSRYWECTYYPPEEGLQRALLETYQAYRLAPRRPRVRQKLQALAPLMEPYVKVQDGQVIFAALTPTPVPTVTATWTPSQTPTATRAPARKPKRTALPSTYTPTPTATFTVTPGASALPTAHPSMASPGTGTYKPISSPTGTAIQAQRPSRSTPFSGLLCGASLLVLGLIGVWFRRYTA